MDIFKYVDGVVGYYETIQYKYKNKMCIRDRYTPALPPKAKETSAINIIKK